MIEHLTIKGFKSFEHVEVELGALNFFVGTNSSGKSNFFDALRVLQGIGYGLRVDEIFNGKPRSANRDVWEPIRGGGAHAGLLRRDAEDRRHTPSLVSLGVRGTTSKGAFVYSITLSPHDGIVIDETLSIDQEELYSSPTTDRRFDRRTTVLGQFVANCSHRHFEQIVDLLDLFSDLQHLNPSPDILREYSSGREVRRLGESGENFAALVKSILSDASTADAYRSWLQRMTPKDLDDVVILEGALGEPLFALEHGGRKFPAPVLSDGTLRFAALTAALFQPDMPRTLIVEEIENGIHPSRLRLLVELLRARSSEKGPQVMASTHSPVIVDWLTTEEYEHCFLFRHDEETGLSIVKPLSEISGFANASETGSAGELLTEGWMETAL